MTMQGNNPPAAGALLSARAMLASVSIKIWSAKKTDKRATKEIHDTKNARDGAGRYNKSLLASSALEKLQGIAGATRIEHYRLTSPWVDSGPRILSSMLFINWANKVREFNDQFDAAKPEFLANYLEYVEQARRPRPEGLGDLFNEADYPSLERVARMFDFSSRVLPMPTASDFRVDLSEAQSTEIRRSIEESTAEALAGVTRDAWKRIADVCGAMVDRLNAYQPATKKGERTAGVFRDTLISNVRDLVSILPAFNIGGQPELAAITERLQRDLCQHSAEDLRESEALRASTARAAESILAEVNDFLA
jgi:hypothetical protein